MIKEGRAEKTLKETMAYDSPKGIVKLCVCVRERQRERERVLSPVQFFETPWTAALQFLYPLDSPGKHTGVGCAPPGDLSSSGVELVSPALQVDLLPSEQPWKPHL